MDPFVLHKPDELTLEVFERILFFQRHLTIDAGLLERLVRTRARMLARLADAGAVYGVNTGMGYVANVNLTESEQAVHQRNLLLGRAVGGPPYLDAVEVRAILLARLAGFLRGHAGVSPPLCQFLADRLNDGFMPAIPRQSIGCSGEIIPLSHAFQTFIGVGSVLTADGQVQEAGAALAERRVAPYTLAEKEGIALLAGAPGALGLAVVHGRAARVLANQLLAAAACMIDALEAPLTPYGEPVGRLASDPVLSQVLHQLRGFLEGARPDRGRVQAPVSFRVTPQVLAHLARATGRLEDDIRRHLQASDDSPAFIEDGFLPNGNFHAIDLAAGLDGIALALVQSAELAAQHIHRLLDGRFSGLPDQLTRRPGPQAGLVVVHKRAVGTLHALRPLAMPSSVGLMDTSMGQEDAMTFAFEAAERLRRIEALVRDLVACQLLTARQAWFLRGRPAAAGLTRFHELLERTVPPVEADRPLGADINRLAGLLAAGAFDGEAQTASA